MKQLTQDQIALLKKPLPAEAIKPHPTKVGMSAINAIHVVERLNDVFGIGGWQTGTTLLHHGAEKKTSSKGREYTEYTCMVQTCFTVPDYGIQHCIIASSTNEDIGDAAKGATTDALTKVASWLGIGMDVWKTKDGASQQPAQRPAQTQQAEPDKPWLNEDTQEFAKASAWMQSQPDKESAIKKLRERYAISNKIATLLKGGQNNG